MQSSIFAAVVGVGVFAGAFVFLNPQQERPAEVATELHPVHVNPPAEPAPQPPAPQPQPKAEAEPPAPPPKPRPALVVARWAVAKAVVDGREDGFATRPEHLAVSDDGTRVVVGASRFVDLWQKGEAAAVRIQPKRWQGAFVAPDAARAYVVGESGALETWDTATGKRLATWAPQSSRTGWAPRYFAHGWHPTTHALSVVAQSPDACGFYDISPTTGQGTRTAPIKELHECADDIALFPLRSGGYVTHFGPSRLNAERGLVFVARDGTRTRGPHIPEDDKKFGYSLHPALSADERYAALCAERKLAVWDMRTGKRLLEWEKEYYFATQTAFVGSRVVVRAASDYYRVVGPGFPVLLQMYDVPTCKKLGEFVPHNAGLPSSVFAFSPNGKYLALANDKAVVVLDAAVAFGVKE